LADDIGLAAEGALPQAIRDDPAFGPFGFSSSGVKLRPSIGCTPSPQSGCV
jgi:hypothetical protein